jgi:hypothetical protein
MAGKAQLILPIVTAIIAQPVARSIARRGVGLIDWTA